MKILSIIVFISLIVLLSSQLHAQNGVTLLGHLDIKHGTISGVSYSACWGYVAPNGREYAIMGTVSGTAIIDITNTDSLREIVHIPGPSSEWREMRTYKDRAYVVSEGGSGVQIINLANLPNTANLVRSFTYSSGGNNITYNHTIEIVDGYMYLNGSQGWGNNGTLIFSLAKVDTPQFVGQYQPDYIHDCYVKGNKLYGAAIYSGGGIYVADITNKANPVQIGKISYTGSGTHNMWTTTNGNVLMTTDEIGSVAKTLKFWNVASIPPMPTSTIATYTINPNAIVHNVFTRGNYACVAWYTAGIAIVDVTNPSSPTTAGFYDTSTMPDNDYNGVWTMYPYYWSGKMMAGDMQNGLYVFRFDGFTPRVPVTLLEPANSQVFCSANSIDFKWTRVTDPVKDPHTYTLSLKGPGKDTTYVLSSDTTFTLTNVSALTDGTYRWYITTKDEATQVPSHDTLSFVKSTKFLTLASPDTTTMLKAFTNVPVQWSFGCVDTVEIAYSLDNGTSWNTIESAVPAQLGSYTWNVPATPTTQGRVRVRSKSDTTLVDISSVAFTIYLSGTVHVIAPNGGESWEEGTVHQISWSFTTITNVRIEYTINNGKSWISIVSDTAASTGTYDWLIPVFGASKNARIRVKDKFNSTTNDQSDASFTIHHSVVSVQVVAPNGGEQWNTGTQQTITWSVLGVDSIAIELSVDSGGSWQTIAANLSATDGSYLWTINGISTKNALIRIRNLANASILDTSDEVFEIPVLSMPVARSWNLVSVPLYPTNPLISDLFPGASTQAFKYLGGYVELDSATTGKGFWIKYDTAASIPMFGSASVQETVDVKAKWNIIGSLTQSFLASSLEPIPNTMTLSSLYSYLPDTGYQIQSTIQPGRGYWIKASTDGKLVMSSSAVHAKYLTTNDLTSLDAIVLKDAKGNSSRLFIGNAQCDNDARMLSELPPVPPLGVFDARFTSQRQVETFTSEGSSIGLDIQSAIYPISIFYVRTGSVEQQISLYRTNNGVKTKIHDFSSSSVVILTSSQEGRLTLEASEQSAKPTTYLLGQNYPNPFNPTTNISFVIAHSSFVALKVYNTLGEEVATLMNETKDAGEYSVQWDAGKLPSGVYMYRLTARSSSSGSGNSFSEMKKMILTK